MLDEEFIKRKIKLIEEELAQLAELKDYSLHELAGDFVKCYAAERLLEKIIVRAIDINRYLIEELGSGLEKVRKYRHIFLVLTELKIYPEEFSKRLAESADFRNELVHDYNTIDSKKIHKTVGEVLKDFTKYCDYIIKFLIKQKKD